MRRSGLIQIRLDSGTVKTLLLNKTLIVKDLFGRHIWQILTQMNICQFQLGIDICWFSLTMVQMQHLTIFNQNRYFRQQSKLERLEKVKTSTNCTATNLNYILVQTIGTKNLKNGLVNIFLDFFFSFFVLQFFYFDVTFYLIYARKVKTVLKSMFGRFET